MKNILLIDGSGWNGVTTVQINIINYFLDKGHSIEVILFDNGIPTDSMKYNRWPRNERIFYHLINHKSFLDKVANQLSFFRRLVKLIKSYHILKQHQMYYAFEYEAGTILSFYKLLYPSANYFLHSIELDEATAGSSLIRSGFKNASIVLTQDKIRLDQLQKLYHLDGSCIMISVNSSRDSNVIDTTPLDFPKHVKERKKILFIGSLIDEHCFPDVLKVTQTIPDDHCLVIHGWGGKKYDEIVQGLVKMKPNNVWVSNFQLDEVTKFRLYSSIDIGLVTFNDRFYNCRYAALSAGKLFDLMRVGKPVIASNILGLKEFVEENQIGFCVNDVSELYFKSATIFSNYEFYAKNSKKIFPMYEFDLNFHYIYKKFVTYNEGY